MSYTTILLLPYLMVNKDEYNNEGELSGRVICPGGMLGFQAEPYTRPACCGWRESIQSGADDYAVGNASGPS